MIRSFTNAETEKIWQGLRGRDFPDDIQKRALNRLKFLDAAESLNDLRNPPSNRLHALTDDRAGRHSISIKKNGVYALSGRTETHMTSKLLTTTNPDWLENDHAGLLLLSEFLEPLDLTVHAVAAAIRLGADHIQSVIDGHKRMDAELDLRLGRYFGMSEGFFLRLQDTYELLEAKRALNGELDLIVQRAA